MTNTPEQPSIEEEVERLRAVLADLNEKVAQQEVIIKAQEANIQRYDKGIETLSDELNALRALIEQALADYQAFLQTNGSLFCRSSTGPANNN